MNRNKMNRMTVWMILALMAVMALPLQAMAEGVSPAAKRYSITYYVDDTQLGETQYAAAGEGVDVQALPRESGYAFSDWAMDPQMRVGTDRFIMPAMNVVFRTTRTQAFYDLVYMIDGEHYITQPVPYGDTVPVTPDAVLDRHSFSGWSVETAGVSIENGRITMPASDVIISGSMTFHGHYVDYQVNNESYRLETNYGAGETVLLLADPMPPEGYAFTGWKVEGDVSLDLSTGLFVMPDQDLTISGRMERSSYTVTYKINGKEEGSPLYVFYGDQVNLAGIPALAGLNISSVTVESGNVTIAEDGTFQMPGRPVVISCVAH